LIRLNVALLRKGFAVGSQYLLTVPGKKSGVSRQTPVSIATSDGTRYIVAAFADAAWVKNVRAARKGTLGRGRHVEDVSLTELDVAEREPALRAFLAQVRGGRRFFGSQTAGEVVAHAALYPVFRVESLNDIG